MLAFLVKDAALLMLDQLGKEWLWRGTHADARAAGTGAIKLMHFGIGDRMPVRGGASVEHVCVGGARREWSDACERSQAVAVLSKGEQDAVVMAPDLREAPGGWR
jgi:hypothetical protein